MISKEDFVRAMDELKKYDEEIEKHNYTLGKLIGGFSNLDVGSNLFYFLISYLTKEFDDSHEWISWWINDTNFGRKEKESYTISWTSKDNKYIEKILDSAEKLYDYLVFSYNERKKIEK